MGNARLSSRSHEGQKRADENDGRDGDRQDQTTGIILEKIQVVHITDACEAELFAVLSGAVISRAT